VAPEPAELVRIGQGRSLHTEVGARLAHLGGGEELRLQPLEITLGLHAVHQDGAHHAAPAYDSDSLDRHDSSIGNRCRSVNHGSREAAAPRENTGFSNPERLFLGFPGTNSSRIPRS
jgi:hypothetical protein